MNDIKPGTILRLEPESAIQRVAAYLDGAETYPDDVIDYSRPDSGDRAAGRRDLTGADLRRVLATARLADRLMDGLERVQSRVTGLLHFDANESAPPDDERWARDLDELNTFVTEVYFGLENAYAQAEGVTA